MLYPTPEFVQMLEAERTREARRARLVAEARQAQASRSHRMRLLLGAVLRRATDRRHPAPVACAAC